MKKQYVKLYEEFSQEDVPYIQPDSEYRTTLPIYSLLYTKRDGSSYSSSILENLYDIVVKRNGARLFISPNQDFLRGIGPNNDSYLSFVCVSNVKNDFAMDLQQIKLDVNRSNDIPRPGIFVADVASLSDDNILDKWKLSITSPDDLLKYVENKKNSVEVDLILTENGEDKEDVKARFRNLERICEEFEGYFEIISMNGPGGGWPVANFYTDFPEQEVEDYFEDNL